MAVINVQRFIADLIGPEHNCESVILTEVYTATIDGQEYACQIEPDAPGKEDHVARYLASQATPASAENAAQEGEEIQEPPPEEEHNPPPEEEHEPEHKRGKGKHGRR